MLAHWVFAIKVIFFGFPYIRFADVLLVVFKQELGNVCVFASKFLQHLFIFKVDFFKFQFVSVLIKYIIDLLLVFVFVHISLFILEAHYLVADLLVFQRLPFKC